MRLSDEEFERVAEATREQHRKAVQALVAEATRLDAELTALVYQALPKARGNIRPGACSLLLGATALLAVQQGHKHLAEQLTQIAVRDIRRMMGDEPRQEAKH